jgi:hypothetical protein
MLLLADVTEEIRFFPAWGLPDGLIFAYSNNRIRIGDDPRE